MAPGTDRTAAAIEARDVVKVYDGGVRALDGVSVTILRNEFFTLLGPSGCGKTTLLRLIAGFEEPTQGHVFLNGAPIERLPPHRRPVNTVFQSYALFPHLTVAENVGFGLEMKRVPRGARERRIAEMLELVKLTGMGGRKPNQLSGGQQQRVALARALATEPAVLLLDEPLSALDLKLRKEMQIELKRLQRDTGITFIFVTHDQEEALTMSDRVAVMREGHVLQVGTPREIYEHPSKRFVADFIGETNFLRATYLGFDAFGARFRLTSGAEVPGPTPHGLAPGAEVTLAVRPERLSVDASADGPLSGRVAEVVYFGTDTTYHVALDGGAGLVTARVQNRATGGTVLAPGTAVAVGIEPAAIQVLTE